MKNLKWIFTSSAIIPVLTRAVFFALIFEACGYFVLGDAVRSGGMPLFLFSFFGLSLALAMLISLVLGTAFSGDDARHARLELETLNETRNETSSELVAVINALQKQIEDLRLEKSLLRQNGLDGIDVREAVRNVLLGLRAQSIILLYLGKESRSEALNHSEINLDDPLATMVAEELRIHLWMLDDAPIPDEMKEAIRKASQYGGQWWEFKPKQDQER